MADSESGNEGSWASPERDAPPCDCRAASASERRGAAGLARLARRIWERYDRDGCSLMAAATACYGLICLIPLGALVMSALGRMLGSTAAPEAERQVFRALHVVLPLQVPGVEEAIRRFPHPTGSWFVEAIGILGLLWASSRLFHTLEDVLTRVWSGHGRGRPLFLRNLIALGATLAAGAIFLATTLTTTAAATLASHHPIASAIPGVHWLSRLANAVCILGAAWLMFLLMYVFLPQERVRWRTAAVGAAVAAILWEVSRIAFARLVAESAAYGRLYGSLAGAVVVTGWIYLTTTIMLLGAETAVVLQENERARMTWAVNPGREG